MKKTLLVFITLVALCLISCEEKRTTAPTGFKAKQVGNAIELSWNPVYEADEYHIENNSTGMSEHTSSTSFIDENPIEGMNNYELRACGSAYGWSNSVYVSCNFEKSGSGGGDGGGGSTNLNAPTGFTLSQTSSYVKLSWNKVSGAYGYAIYRALPEDTEYSYLDQTTSTNYSDYDVISGQTYYYAVAAYDYDYNAGDAAKDYITFNGNSGGGGGNNPGGGGDNPGGGGASKPNTPSGVEATASSSYITVTWNSVSGADYYNVYRSTSASGTYSSVSTVYSTTYTDYNVNAGTTYYYKVTAENSAGESGKSSYASAKINSGGGGGGGNEQHYGPVITEVSGSVSGNYITVKWKTKSGSGWGWDPANKIEVYIHDPIGNETYDGWGWRVDGTYTGSSATSGSHKISGYYVGYKDEYGSVKIAIKASNDYGTDSRTLVYIVDEKKWYY